MSVVSSGTVNEIGMEQQREERGGGMPEEELAEIAKMKIFDNKTATMKERKLNQVKECVWKWVGKLGEG